MNAALDTRPADAAAAPPSARALPVGTRLHGNDYEILGVVSDGTFGINYLARDRAQGNRPIVIKEYLPSMLAWRTPATPTVTTKDPGHDEAFKAGLRSFTNEARLLANFEHPALISILRCWKDHGTAYIAMPLHDAPTLRRVITERGAAPDEAELRAWLRPLLEALEMLHAANCVHGDITPDNILMTADGPLLLGFGAGRRAIGRVTRAPAEVLKSGYAAPEQYALDSVAPLGPWTDLYGLASVLCAVMTGRAPMMSIARRIDERMPPLGELLVGQFSASLVAAVDAALAVSTRERPQDVAAFRALLSGQSARAGQRARGAAPARSPADHHAVTLIAAAAICLIAFGVLGVLALQPHGPAAPAPTAVASPSPPPVVPLELPPTGAGPTAPAAPVRHVNPAPPPHAAPVARNDPPPRRLRAETPSPTPKRPGCSELIQRASLDTPTPAEAAKLKKECR